MEVRRLPNFHTGFDATSILWAVKHRLILSEVPGDRVVWLTSYLTSYMMTQSCERYESIAKQINRKIQLNQKTFFIHQAAANFFIELQPFLHFLDYDFGKLISKGCQGTHVLL